MNRVREWGRRAVVAVLGAVAIGAGLAVPAAAAPAAAPAPDPGVLLCWSKTANNSQYAVLTYRKWTCSWGTTGSSSEGCTDLNGGSLWLAPGEYSPIGQDWDVLRIDAGWCYRVQFIVPAKVWTLTFNRSGLGHLYVKIEDWGTAVVQAQKYGSCP